MEEVADESRRVDGEETSAAIFLLKDSFKSADLNMTNTVPYIVEFHERYVITTVFVLKNRA